MYKVKDPGDQEKNNMNDYCLCFAECKCGRRKVGFACPEYEDEENHAGDPSLLNSVNVSVNEMKKQYTSVAIQSIGPNGKVEVSAKEYLKVKTLLMNFIKDFKLHYRQDKLNPELEEWYKQELKWGEVWKIMDITKKLTKEEYKLLEDHIREQIEFEDEEDN